MAINVHVFAEAAAVQIEEPPEDPARMNADLLEAEDDEYNEDFDKKIDVAELAYPIRI